MLNGEVGTTRADRSYVLSDEAMAPCWKSPLKMILETDGLAVVASRPSDIGELDHRVIYVLALVQ